MHTQHDITENGNRKPIIDKPGCYTLTYEIYADHFPVTVQDVKLRISGNNYFVSLVSTA